MMISRITQKQIAYPHRQKSRTRYAKFSQALGGPKSRTPQFEVYATFFRVAGTKYAKSIFRVALRDFRATSA